MKNIVIIILFLSSVLWADSTLVSPSFYFTYGNYSSKDLSKSYAFYNTSGITKNYSLTVHYDNLLITGTDWNYLQQTFLAGNYFNFFPFGIKLTYAHLKGDYSYTPYPIKYSDFTNLYNLDLFYYKNLYYLGLSFTYLDAKGILNITGLTQQKVSQLTLRLEKIVFNELFVSIKPNYSQISDGRKLFSLFGKFHYLLSSQLLLKAGGMIGKRAYYFDSDLLTIYNQDYTQTSLYFGQFEYSVSSSIKLISSYQHTKFQNYSINYFILGIKSNFFF
jgi:hypothetical protein